MGVGGSAAVRGLVGLCVGGLGCGWVEAKCPVGIGLRPKSAPWALAVAGPLVVSQSASFPPPSPTIIQKAFGGLVQTKGAPRRVTVRRTRARTIGPRQKPSIGKRSDLARKRSLSIQCSSCSIYLN